MRLAGRELGLRQLTRGLRFRLALSYFLFFFLLMIAVGLIFRQTLSASLEKQSREVLEEEWGAAKGYLRIEAQKPVWYYDREDPDEALIVNRLQQVLLLADENGKILQSSVTYRDIGEDSPEHIHDAFRGRKTEWRTLHNRDGEQFLIRSAVILDEEHKSPYYLAIGRTLEPNRAVLQNFTWIYVATTPLLLLLCGVLGWLFSARTLRPLTSVAEAAQRVSSSNLSLRIPTRRAGDELDFLIETFNGMVERLESSFRQIRQFSTDVSHELRTPITAIRGQLEVALFTAKSVDHYRDAILNSLEDIERLSHTVRSLLELAQAESGQIPLHKSRVDLAAIVADVVDQFQVPAEDSRVRLSCSVPDSCEADADRIQIYRLLMNLVGNAIKFTPAGGEIWVLLSRPEPGLIGITVEDTGPGIAPEHLPHIFDRFYRVQGVDPQREKGLGLGLSFVAWIARAHGGTVEAFSEFGFGARFTVKLPAPPADSRTPEAAPDEGKSIAQQAS